MIARPYRAGAAKETGLSAGHPCAPNQWSYGPAASFAALTRLRTIRTRKAVADVERPPTAQPGACSGRTIAGMRVIPPPGGSRRRECSVEEKERGNDGRDQDEMQFVHRTAPFNDAPIHSMRLRTISLP